MKHTTEFGIAFSYWEWSDLEAATLDLAAQITASGKTYDRIIALANGGLTMVRLLGDRLGTNKMSSVQLSFYQGINELKKEPQIIQPLTMRVAKQNILIFEDIVDTGATLEFALEYIKDHGVASVETASLVLKKKSRVTPEFHSVVEESWVVFPYEARETIEELTAKWLASDIELMEVHAALARIGFSPEEISRYSLLQ